MPHTRPISRLLIIRNDRLGDLVLSLPAFAAARRAFPQAQITVLVHPTLVEVLAGNPNIDQVLADQPELAGPALGQRLREHRFDAALVMAAYPRNCWAAWKAGIPQRVTWGYKPSALFCGNRHLWMRRSRPPIHESDFALAFVKALDDNARLDPSQARLEVDPAARARIEERLSSDLGTEGPLFGVHPGNFNSAYNWSPARYAELIGMLAEHGRVVVTGGSSEQPLLAEVRRHLNLPAGARVAFYHDLSLAELVALIAELDSLTVSSTGPMHLAGVLNTPLVALFSPHPSHSPEKWRPLGEKQVLLQPRLMPGVDPFIPKEQGVAVMERITAQEALAANLRHLAHRPQAIEV